jgi:hypothetical protein
METPNFSDSARLEMVNFSLFLAAGPEAKSFGYIENPAERAIAEVSRPGTAIVNNGKNHTR